MLDLICTYRDTVGPFSNNSSSSSSSSFSIYLFNNAKKISTAVSLIEDEETRERPQIRRFDERVTETGKEIQILGPW